MPRPPRSTRTATLFPYAERFRSVDIGVGHDDDACGAQIVGDAVLAGAAAQGLDQIGNLQIGEDLGGGGAGDVEDLAANRQDRLRLAIARLLGRAAGRIALDDEDLGARRSEEHTSELQSLMRISYAVFCLKKKKKKEHKKKHTQ